MASRRAAPVPALVLFDIDGTLLRRSGPHHRRALEDAVRRVTGCEVSTDGMALQGMLDPDILTRLMLGAGLKRAEVRRLLPEVMRTAENLYVRRCPDLRAKVCPGARAALARLKRAGIPAGLVTGNLPRIGWTKMRRAGLRDYLRFGAFAGQAPTRAALVRLALAEARRRGWMGRGSRATLIGDHPNDVRAAQANGIRAVAVATGLSPAAELERCAPDLLLADLRELRLAMLLP